MIRAVLPKGGFGNLIALPLQKQPREHGWSVFVDDGFQPHADQWSYLASVQTMDSRDIEGVIFRTTGGAHPLDVAFIAEEDQAEPWKPPPAQQKRLAGTMPASRACGQDRRTGDRLCGWRPSGAAAHVGETPARLPGNGLSGPHARRRYPAPAGLKPVVNSYSVSFLAVCCHWHVSRRALQTEDRGARRTDRNPGR